MKLLVLVMIFKFVILSESSNITPLIMELWLGLVDSSAMNKPLHHFLHLRQLSVHRHPPQWPPFHGSHPLLYPLELRTTVFDTRTHASERKTPCRYKSHSTQSRSENGEPSATAVWDLTTTASPTLFIFSPSWQLLHPDPSSYPILNSTSSVWHWARQTHDHCPLWWSTSSGSISIEISTCSDPRLVDLGQALRALGWIPCSAWVFLLSFSFIYLFLFSRMVYILLVVILSESVICIRGHMTTCSDSPWHMAWESWSPSCHRLGIPLL
jgi:hypothetical protein